MTIQTIARKAGEKAQKVSPYVWTESEARTFRLAYASAIETMLRFQEWVDCKERCPDLIDGKSKPLLVRYKKYPTSKHDFTAVAYYFPNRFKTIEFEDWDDYTGEEDFPYTEDDKENQIVWLREGWYIGEDCDRCDRSVWVPIKPTHWKHLPDPPGTYSQVIEHLRVKI